jgi:hypothetical protein
LFSFCFTAARVHSGGVLLRSVPRAIRGRYLLKVTFGANGFYFTTFF